MNIGLTSQTKKNEIDTGSPAAINENFDQVVEDVVAIVDALNSYKVDLSSADDVIGGTVGTVTDIVYTGTAADTLINNTTDVTIVTRDVASVAAGDQVMVEAWFTILNNSGLGRSYTITLDFDGLFDIELTTGGILANSATLAHPFCIRGICDVRSTSLVYGIIHIMGQVVAGLEPGADTSMAASHLAGFGWNTSASNATGTLTVALKIRSGNQAETQTLRLHQFTIRKVTPT